MYTKIVVETVNVSTKNIFTKTAILVFSLAVLLTACGNGGGGGGGGGHAASHGTIIGTVIKGPVSGGTVTAFAITDGAMGTQIGMTTTDAHGNFSVGTGNYAGPVMLQLMHGSYTDEATAQVMNMYQNTVMTAMIANVTSGETIHNIQITPLTSMAQAMAQYMSGGMTPENITAANSAMGQYFDIGDILTTLPMNPLVTNSSATTNPDQQNYGMVIAGISQEAADLGMPYSSGMVTAMMDDASDGYMDGYMGSTQIGMGGMGGMSGMMNTTMMDQYAGTTGLSNAIASFIDNTTVNMSGLTVDDMQTLIDKLNNSDGTIQ